ncbi:MAG: hypothetical protein AB8G05_22340 [Oligoflexales bacterium]
MVEVTGWFDQNDLFLEETTKGLFGRNACYHSSCRSEKGESRHLILSG